MADYFLDTSASVKRHVKEAGSRWVKSLVSPQSGHRLFIARITAVELTSAITRRQHPGDLTATQAGAILGHFRRHLTQRYRVVELTPGLFEAAMKAARTHRLRAYDAVQLAVALEVNSIHQACPSGEVHLQSRVTPGDDATRGASGPVRETSPCLDAAPSTSAGRPSSTISAAAA
jgi:predicted nucleic acid-binding protein